jgi:hypothetical protein
VSVAVTRIILLLVTLLGALLLVTDTYAIKTAAGGTTFSIAVTGTDSAALALSPGAGNAANQITVNSAGVLHINFRKGYTGASSPSNYGFQPSRMSGGLTAPADLYRMRQVIRITDNASYNGGLVLQCHSVSVTVAGAAPANLDAIYGSGVLMWSGSGLPVSPVILQGGTSIWLDFWWNRLAVSTSGNVDIRVSATRVTCP